MKAVKTYDHLKISNQICFPVYAASRLITREYQPYLDKMGITYPQYLVLMVLWEADRISVNDISQLLVLNTNTVTPLLKRMETLGILTRTRSNSDERKVIVELTKKGKEMREEASAIPGKLVEGLQGATVSIEDMVELRDKLNVLINYLKEK
jgi:MarR family transcriptional regulator, organic hydroperoxide resistance regulator